jgi:hypothetical protein
MSNSFDARLIDDQCAEPHEQLRECTFVGRAPAAGVGQRLGDPGSFDHAAC